MTALPTALAAARLRLVTQRPYLASALWALQPVERPGLGTLAVDAYWRLYWDPAAVEEWSGEQLAAVLYHEVCHLLRDHHGRADAVGAEPRRWNLAGDAEINDDLRAEAIPLPERAVYPAAFGQPDGLLAEEYYAALDQARESAPQQGQPQGGAARPSRRPDDAASAPPDAPPDGEGSSPSPQPGDADGSKPGSGAGSTSAAPPGQPSAAPGHGGDPSQSAHQPGSGHAGGTSDTPDGTAGQTPAPGCGHCGSCAHGQREPWEEPAPGVSGAAPGINHAEAEIVRRHVAEEIRVAASTDSRGTVPGHWRRWADAHLRPPQVDWRRELAALCRRALADASGAADYSYRRPSRRQAVASAILPALRQPVPQVCVVVDTSGSVGDNTIAQVLGEVAGILRAAGQREGVTVLAVDAAVQSSRRVFRPQQVSLCGGGGTDMGVGIAAAGRLRPLPQVCIVITDGHTPWPAEAPASMAVVVCLVGNGQAPDWARAVRAGEGGRQ